MKKQVVTISFTILLTILCLFLLNYFTLIGLRLPHQTQIIYQWEHQDIFVAAFPQYCTINNDGIPPDIIIETLYPLYGKDNVNDTWVVTFEGTELPPEDFPLAVIYNKDLERISIVVPVGSSK